MVTMITFMGETTDCVFPFNAQHESSHEELFQNSIVKNASKSMTNEGQYRHLVVMLLDEVGALYT